jgi:hypothetical protein
MRLPIASFVLLVLAAPSTAQQVPGTASDKPQVFGPGVLSAGEVYRGSFTPDGQTFYFFKKVGADEDYRILMSRFERGAWSQPARVSLGGEFSDLYPSISRDGRRLVFTSYRPFPGDTAHTAHVWYTERMGGDRWGNPVPLTSGSRPGHYHSWSEIGRDDAIYFRRTTPDWRTTETLVARRDPRGSGYLDAVVWEQVEMAKRLRPGLNVVGGNPGPTDDVVFLDVATRDSASGRHASDIWILQKVNDGWGEPQRLDSGINGPDYETFPFFSPDGRDLFFVRAFKEFYRVRLEPALDSAR